MSAALVAAAAERERPVTIPAAISLGDLAELSLPARGALVYLVNDHEEVIEGRIVEYRDVPDEGCEVRLSHPSAANAPPSTFGKRVWFEVAEVFLSSAHAYYHLAHRSEESRVACAEDAAHETRRRDRFLACAEDSEDVLRG